MTFLFLRFYCFVLAILAIAWAIQAFNASQTRDDNFKVIQDVYAGQMRVVNYLISQSEDRGDAVERIGGVFAFDVTYIPAEEIAPGLLTEELNFYTRQDAEQAEENGFFVISQLPTKDGYVRFGPLPELVAPSLSAQLVGLGLLLLLAAIAIAILLRPMVKQLSRVEKTAMAIAGGDLTARIDESRTGSARRMASSFNFMAEKTAKLLESQRQLLHCVSHELRTPIAKLRFAIDLIRDATSEQELETRLQGMEGATDELQTLVDELLGYVKLESMESRLQLEHCNLKEILERQIRTCRELFPKITFSSCDNIEEGNVLIHADRIMLERVFSNLLGNAARFARSRVNITVHCGEGVQQILVEDDGCGISESDREKIFEPFAGVHEEKSGTGLGLTIVKKIVENHESKIEVGESPDGGCRITLHWASGDFRASADGTGADASMTAETE